MNLFRKEDILGYTAWAVVWISFASLVGVSIAPTDENFYLILGVGYLVGGIADVAEAYIRRVVGGK